MCGIAGICNFTGDWKENIERMKRHMKKRGPNADGTWSSEDHRVVFGHQRLSIVDLSAGGAQPMTSHSGRYTMTYNGEIYNYKELADKEEGVIFGGRLAEYRYYDMDKVIDQALKVSKMYL